MAFSRGRSQANADVPSRGQVYDPPEADAQRWQPGTGSFMDLNAMGQCVRAVEDRLRDAFAAARSRSASVTIHP
ncbi:MAG: hypothetical protein MZU95_10240 [Desulfomicrobium escambiense]|nr:hypothetical protein [Desulfomicrobium escambiense]